MLQGGKSPSSNHAGHMCLLATAVGYLSIPPCLLQGALVCYLLIGNQQHLLVQMTDQSLSLIFLLDQPLLDAILHSQ